MKNLTKNIKFASLLLIAILMTIGCKKEAESNEQLKNTSIYLRWNEDTTCPPLAYNETYKYPNLPSMLTKSQYYGSLAAGIVEVIVNHSNSSMTYYFNLVEPPSGYNRYYTNITWQYNSALNRCLLALGNGLNYVDVKQ